MKKLDFSFKNNEPTNKGSILISDPFSDDVYFGRSVVLICEHNDEGTFGFVLNNYIDVDLHQLDDNFPNINARISFGGPVSKENLYYIHSFSDITNTLEIREGLYYGGDFDEITDRIKNAKNPNKEIRFFMGYSGWSPSQLDEEIKNESWITANNISTEDVLDTKLDDLWRICLEKQGQRFQLMTKFPRNPMDN
ncbi:MAG: YqgE/AlgH family protein [Crocinitomicaceae bacterium]|jgi:putative transcriptional regulator